MSTSGDGSDVMLIDFASTRRGHVFFDFIVFEVNLRLDCREKISLRHSSKNNSERDFNGWEASDVPCASEILHLRNYAGENLRSVDGFLYGLASFCFSLLTAPNLPKSIAGFYARAFVPR